MNERDYFKNFTDQARQIFGLAQEEAKLLQHEYIGTEHLLLALVREDAGIAARVLAHLGADLASIRATSAELIEQEENTSDNPLGMTPEAIQVIEATADEAYLLKHQYIGSEHLLLGLARVPQCRAYQILQSMDIHLHNLRTHTIQVLSQSKNGIYSSSTTITDVTPPTPYVNPNTRNDQRTRFGKFSERARKVLSLAQEEALRFQHNYIGTEHILLGLVSEGEGVAAHVLGNLGVELNKVRHAVEFIIGRGDRLVLGEIGLTPRSKKVIELAVDEARLLNHQYIGTEHLLLGLVREGEGIAAGVLAGLGVNLMRVRNETLRVLTKDTHTSTTVAPLPTADVPPPHWKSRNSFDDYQFTASVEHVLKYAQEEAFNLRHNYVGTEHLLLGLLRQDDTAARILKSLGTDLMRTRAEVERLIGQGTRTMPTEVSLTPLARAQIHLAADEASRLGHSAISTEHLLLGMVREGEGIASSVLGSLGVSLEMVRTKTLEFM